MTIDRDESELKIPSDVTAVVAEFKDRASADKAIEALTRVGFETDQVSFVARGADTVDGKFVPGTLMITVHPEGRSADATRILREHGGTEVKSGTVTATGDVVEGSEAEPEEATSA